MSVVLYDLTYVYNMQPAPGYEEMQAVAAIQGLVNRDAAQLFVLFTDADAFWLSELRKPGAWLASATFTNATSVEDLVSRFASYLRGAVVYDPAVWPTSLLASTSAGAEDLLPVCFRPTDPTSLYSRLVAAGPKLSVGRSLVGLFNGSISGSVKLDAYNWAVAEFIRSNRSDASVQGYFIDYFWTTVADVSPAGQGYAKVTTTNHDFVIARRGFFWDLDTWADEAPVDDPKQPLGSDYKAFTSILQAAYDQTGGQRMIHISGFTPWAYKYVGGKHGGVDTEWQTVKVTSAFNAYVDADACCIGDMANAAFFQHFPLPARFVQRGPPTKADLVSKGFLTADGSAVVGDRLYWMGYMGDYDSAAWLYSQLESKWSDPARGSVPLGWGVDPELSIRFPVIFPYLYSSATPNDYIITGDSGAGYINPPMLFNPGRATVNSNPDGRATWIAHSSALYRQFGMTFTGFIINGASLPMDSDSEAIYQSFSPHGGVEQGFPGVVTHLTNNLPFFPQYDLSASASDSAATIASFYQKGATNFHMFRAVLTTPSFLQSVAEQAAQLTGGAAVLVDPLTLSFLARVALGGSNDDFVTYMADNLPATLPATSTKLFLNATVRNDGWNDWPGNGTYSLSVTGTRARDGASTSTLLPVRGSTSSAATTFVFGSVALPSGSISGDQLVVSYGLVGPSGPLSDRGCLPWETTVALA